MLNFARKRLSRILATALALLLALSSPAWALTAQEAYDLLSYYYVDGLPAGLEDFTSVEELIAALGDPYTSYMTPEQYSSFVSSINDSSLVGIGVTVQVTEDGLLIASVLDGSPALAAGLTAGDEIIAADGTDLAGLGDGATALIRGEEGTQVALTIRRADGSTLHCTLTRQLIVIPNTTTEVVDGSWGYILCDSFGDNTAEHFADGLETYDSEVDSWIVDLRSNPGGTSDAAATAAAYFTGPGVLVYFRDGDDNYNYTFAPVGFAKLTDKPLMVLTSAYSASGSELFSAAVRDYGVGTLMGQRTYGKGVAQLLLTSSNYPGYFQDGSALKVTTYRFFSPNGTTNDKIGVIPDLLVSDEAAATLATLLTGGAPTSTAGWLSLTINGITWYMDLSKAAQESAAVAELLSALPPSATLRLGQGGGSWTESDRAAVAARLGLTLTTRDFLDVADSPYADQINTLACYQLVLGDGQGHFRPSATITRGELACLITSLLRVEANGAGYFSDVADGDWYANGVNALYELGFTVGYEDGTFRPNATVTRQEMIVMMARLGAWLNMDLYDQTAGESDADLSGFSAWARPAASLCDSFGLLWTDPEQISAGTAALREEAAALLCNLLTYANILPD